MHQRRVVLGRDAMTIVKSTEALRLPWCSGGRGEAEHVWIGRLQYIARPSGQCHAALSRRYPPAVIDYARVRNSAETVAGAVPPALGVESRTPFKPRFPLFPLRSVGAAEQWSYTRCRDATRSRPPVRQFHASAWRIVDEPHRLGRFAGCSACKAHSSRFPDPSEITLEMTQPAALLPLPVSK
jgi:hypothetical protein